MRRVKTLYCIAVIAIAIVLDCTGGMVGWVAAVVVLSGALPMYQAVSGAASDTAADETLRIVERQLTSRDR